MKTPIQKYRERQEKKRMVGEIKEKSRLYEKTLDQDLVRDLIKLHIGYREKYGKEYKG